MEEEVESIIRRVCNHLDVPERCYSYMAGMVIEDPPSNSKELLELLQDFLSDGLIKGDSEIKKITEELWSKLKAHGIEGQERMERIVAQKMTSGIVLGEAGIATESIIADYIDPILGIQKASVNTNTGEKL